MTEYTAVARGEGRWWIVQWDQHPGALCHRWFGWIGPNRCTGRRSPSSNDVPIESVSITVHPEMDPQVDDELATAQRLHAEAAAADRRATELKTHPAQRLKDQGLTVRDIGALLGVNYQYAAKLSSGQVRETSPLLTRSSAWPYSIIGTQVMLSCGVLAGEVIVCLAPTRHRSAELRFVAQTLAWHYGRQAVPVVDVDEWLTTNEHRRTTALLVVWDRTDVAILARERSDVEVAAAAPRLG